MAHSGNGSAARSERRGPRKPATKFPHLRKKQRKGVRRPPPGSKR